MSFPKPSTRLAALLEESLSGRPAGRRVMFGCPSFFNGDNMFAGVFGESLILRLPEDERRRLLAADPRFGLFEPFPGRPMRQYLALDGRGLAAGPELAGWLDAAWDYAGGLAPKAGPKRRK